MTVAELKQMLEDADPTAIVLTVEEEGNIGCTYMEATKIVPFKGYANLSGQPEDEEWQKVENGVHLL